MSFAEKLQQDRRLLILLALKSAAGYRAASRLLMTFLESMGHESTHDQVLGELQWLKEQNFIALFESDGVTVASLLERGQDIVDGKAKHPGVRRPAPGEF